MCSHLSGDVIIAKNKSFQGRIDFKSIGEGLDALLEHSNVVPLQTQQRDGVVHLSTTAAIVAVELVSLCCGVERPTEKHW